MTILFPPPTLVTDVFGVNTEDLPFTDTETAFLSTTVLMTGSAIAVYLVM